MASWLHRFEGNRMWVKIAPFSGDKLQFGVDAGAFDVVRELLGAILVEVDYYDRSVNYLNNAL